MSNLKKCLALLLLLPGLANAAMKVSIVQAAAATGTPTFTQDFTDSTTFGGATPKCAIVLGSAATANDSSTATIQATIGFVASSTQASIGISDDDAVSTNSSGYANYSTQAYSMPDFGGNTSGDATGAMIANGVRLSWTDQSAAELVNVILIGGDVECAVASLTSNNTTSAQAVTHGLTAAPQAIIAMTPGQGSGDATGNARYGLGFWDGTNSKTLAVSLNQTGQATVTAAGHLSSTVAIGVKANAAGFVWTGAISNVGATTFDLTTSANTTNVMHFLSLRSTSGTALGVKAGTFGTKTSTGTNADISGMSQAPQLVLYGLSRTIAVDTNYSGADDASVLGLGAAVKNTGTGSTQYATTVNCSVDGAATSTNHAYSQTSNTEVIRIPDANASCAADVEATINSWDSGGVTNNYSNIAATGRQVMYLAIGADVSVSAPTWSVSPTVSAQDDNDYTLSYTPSTSATFYAVACAKDATAPTIAQVKAGNCTGDAAAIASANEAVTGADTTVLGGSLTRPVHDLYAVLSNGGGDSTLATLADECLDAATGKTFVGGCPGGLTSIHANSPFALFNAQATPDVAVGDIPICDSALTPNSALTLTWTAAGLFSYPGGDPSKQSYTCTFYDLSAGAMHADTWTGYVNNVAPVALFAAYETALVKDAAMASVDFATQFYDPDDATLTYTSSDTGTGTGANTRPAGTSQTTGVWSGTPTSTDGSIGSWTETATDEAGDAASMPVQWGVYAQVAVPDCAGLDVASCAALGAAVHLEVMATYDCSNSVAANYVVSQSPAATTVVDPFTALAVAASSGACSGISAWTTKFLADGVSVPSTAVYVDGAAFTHSGGRYVAPLPASARTVFLRGLQYRQDGALIINTTDAITHYVRGIGLTAQGEVKAATCSPDYVVAGVPMDPDGTVCMTDIN